MKAIRCIMVGLLAACSGGLPRPSDMPDSFSLGLTEPMTLLRYVYSSQLPEYCRHERILERIAQFAATHQCTANDTSIGGIPIQQIICPIAAPDSDTCPSTYIAELWQEREAGSSENYELLMFARVRRVCAREKPFRTYDVSDEIAEHLRSQAKELRGILNSCRIYYGV